MRIKEEWKQPVKPSDAWKSIIFTMIFLAGAVELGPVIFHSRYDRLSWAVLLLVIWVTAAARVTKIGWRAWQPFQTLWLVAYTFFAGGHLVPQGTAASWLTGVGALLLTAAFAVMIFDFRKSRTPVSADIAPPVQRV